MPHAAEPPIATERPPRNTGRPSLGERVLRTMLLVVGTVLAVFTGFLVAIPHFPAGARPGSNDAAAIATMKAIATAQARFLASRQNDQDGDGDGEFGYFIELAKGDATHPPRLSAAFGNTVRLPNGAEVVQRSGYYFQVFLPDAGGDGVAEGSDTSAVDPDGCERCWCCYAWPVIPNVSGKRVFFVNQDNVVLWRRFGGGFAGRPSPAPDAAFVPLAHDCADGTLAHPIAAGQKGGDGRVWSVIR